MLCIRAIRTIKCANFTLAKSGKISVYLSQIINEKNFIQVKIFGNILLNVSIDKKTAINKLLKI